MTVEILTAFLHKTNAEFTDYFIKEATAEAGSDGN